MRSGNYIWPIPIETAYVIASYLIFFQCVTYSLAMPTFYFCERLNLNIVSPTFVRFTIVMLTWHDFTSYSIVLPMLISVQAFHALSIYFRCIIYGNDLIAYIGFGIIASWPYFLYSSVCLIIWIILLFFVNNVRWGHCTCMGCNTVSVMWRHIV